MKQENRLQTMSKKGTILSLAFLAIVLLASSFVPSGNSEGFLQQRFGARANQGLPLLEMSIVNWQVANYIENCKQHDVIFLGDSSCLMGVMPKVISEKIGKSCWNLGTIGHLGTAGHAAILARVLEKVPAPRVVVYQIAPATITSSNELALYYRNLLKDWLGENAIATDSKSIELPTERLRRRVSHELSRLAERIDLGQNYYNKPRGKYPSDNQTREILLSNNGWFPELPELIEKSVIDSTKFDDFNKQSEVGLRRLFEESQKYGFKLIITMAPLPSGCATAENKAKYDGFYEAISSISKEYPNCTVQTPLLRTMPDNSFATINHPTPTGAMENSLFIANWLKKYTSAELAPASIAKNQKARAL